YAPSARTSTTVTVSGTDINDSELSGAWQIGEPLPPLPAPLAEYRMEEAAWSGATGEVADSSGNDRSGTSFNGANTDDGPPVPIAGDPATCRYATCDGSNDYFEVADLSDILGGTASLAFWIRTTQAGNDTGWEAPGVTGVEQGGGADDIFWGWLDAAGR